MLALYTHDSSSQTTAAAPRGMRRRTSPCGSVFREGLRSAMLAPTSAWVQDGFMLSRVYMWLSVKHGFQGFQRCLGSVVPVSTVSQLRSVSQLWSVSLLQSGNQLQSFSSSPSVTSSQFQTVRQSVTLVQSVSQTASFSQSRFDRFRESLNLVIVPCWRPQRASP